LRERPHGHADLGTVDEQRQQAKQEQRRDDDERRVADDTHPAEGEGLVHKRGAGKALGRPLNTTMARFSSRNETATADVKSWKRGTSRSGLSAARSMITPSRIVRTIARGNEIHQGKRNIAMP